jgi:hypothetical protein
MIVPPPPRGREFAQYAVFAQYGQTMFMVQSFEHALAILVGVAETCKALESADPTRRLSSEALQRKLRSQTRRATHLHHKATAAELRAELKKKVDDQELLDEIEPLIEWRAFLAHRYLLARLVDRKSNELQLTQAVLDELAELAVAFNAAVERINAKAGELASSAQPHAPQGPGDEHAEPGLRNALHALIESTVSAQPPRFTRRGA